MTTNEQPGLATQGHTRPSSAELVGSFFQDFAQGDLTAIDRYFTPDVEYTVIGPPSAQAGVNLPPLTPEALSALPWIGTYRGRDGVREFLAHLLRNIEVMGFGPQEVFAEGDRAAVFGWFHYRARSTGGEIKSAYSIQITIRDGQIARYHFLENTYAVAAAFRTGGRWDIDNDGRQRSLP